MTYRAHSEDHLKEIMSKMRIGDYLHVPKDEGDTRPAELLRGTIQPYRVVRVRDDRKPPLNHVGLPGYKPAQLEQLYYSDTRISSFVAIAAIARRSCPNQLENPG